MSTELECVNSGSDVVDGSNSLRVEVGNGQMSETLADPSSGQDQKLDKDELQGCVTVEPSSAGDNGMEKINGFTDLEKEMESVNGGLDLGIGTQNVDDVTNEKEKKVPVDTQEVMMAKADKDSLGVQKELLVEKDVQAEMVSSHGTSLSDLEKEPQSVNGGLDLGIGTKNVDVKTNEREKRVPVDSQEVMTVKADKDSLGIKTELLVEKDMQAEIVSSHGTSLSDVKGSEVRLEFEDLGEDINSHGSGQQGTEVDDFDVEGFVGLEPYKSKEESILDDEPVTEKLFSDSDLVWAKVRSHPWWPGQVFDSSAATDKAKKYSKKGSFLVTYFGDCTFAWNDASRLKPFRQHFSQMAKQSTLPDFLDAIDFALEEVSRRIEFGLACSCISEEVYQQIKTQEVINPGIREDSSRIHGGDKVSSAVSFEPANLVEYVKRLACSPNYDSTDEMQFVCQRARLLAFNRWKGYTELPEFELLQGSLESAPKTATAEEKSSLLEVIVSVPEPKKTEQVYAKRRKTEEEDNCKQVFEYEDTTVIKKKEKTLAEFIAETRLSRSNGKITPKNSDVKPHSEKKRKVVYSKLTKSTKKTKLDLQTEDPGSPFSAKKDGRNDLPAGGTVTPQKARSSFGIGASILRVANQMHCSTPTGLVPCKNSTSKMVAKNNGSKKSLQEKPKAKALSETISSPQSPLTKTPSVKPNSIGIDHQQAELEQVIEKSPNANLPEESMLESRDLKDSSKEQMLHEDNKETEKIADEVTVNNRNLVGQKITGSDFKEQPNCSDGTESSKEDVSAE